MLKVKMKAVIIAMLLFIVGSKSSYADEAGRVVSAILEVLVERVFSDDEDVITYHRKILERTKEGNYLIQDFYDTGEKLTDPFLVRESENILINIDNEDFTEPPYNKKEDLESYGDELILGALTIWHKNGIKAFQQNFINGQRDGEAKWWYDNGQLRQELSYHNGVRKDVLMKWYVNGQLKQQAYYDKGALEGVFIQWHDNGQKKQEGAYKNGKQTGLWVEWHANGQKQQQVNYINGNQTGASTRWFDSGRTEMDAVYQLDSNGRSVRKGLFIRWHANGKKAVELDNSQAEYVSRMWDEKGDPSFEMSYKEGKLEGITTVWTGRNREQLVYKQGRLVKILYPDYSRKLIKQTENGYLVQDFFKDGKKRTDPFLITDKVHITSENFDYTKIGVVGHLVTWDNEGQKMFESTLKNNLLDGVAQNWHSSGTLVSKYNYISGKLDGEQAAWSPTGEQAKFHYKQGKLEGLQTSWYNNGQKYKEQLYKNGEKIKQNTWYRNGQLKATSIADTNGNIEELEYNHNGQQKIKYECSNCKASDKKVTIWAIDNKDYVQGFIEGDDELRALIWKNNKKRVELRMKDTQLEGVTIHWYENGHIASQGKYQKNERVGLWTYYYENGNKQMQGEFEKSQQIGTWSYWDKKGNKTTEVKNEHKVIK